MSCTVLCASAQFARRSSGRRAAFSSWHPARQRAIRLRIHGERRKARCFRDAAGSLPKQTLAATPETLAPSAASGGAANCLLHCGTRVPRACGAEPSTVRRHRERPAQTRPPSLATLQAFTSPASRHSFNPASPRRIVGFIVPRGTQTLWASSACDKPKWKAIRIALDCAASSSFRQRSISTM
jgi:hypothetical protein